MTESVAYLNYLIIDSNPFQLHMRRLAFARSTPPHFVSHIRALINSKQMVSEEYSVYNVEINLEGIHSLRQLADIDHLLNESLPNYARISKYWPQGFPPKTIHVVLKKPSEGISMTPSVVRQNANLPSVDVEDNEAVQSEAIKAPATHYASSLSSTSNYKNHPNQSHRIPNGRPAGSTSPPIGLYHPVFDSFHRRIDSTSFDVTPEQLSNTLRLITAFQDTYVEELGAESRAGSLSPILESLLGSHVNSTEATGIKSDGTIQATNGGYCMIMEMTNEIDIVGSDYSIQGTDAFAKYWAQDRLKWIRRQCCCPTFILAIAGPWICVLGGVMLKHPVVQPLTPCFSVAKNPLSGSSPDDIARLFASLALSISDLCEFYQGIDPLGGPERQRFYPHIRHFTHNGKCVGMVYEGQISTKAVFRATAIPEEGDRYLIMVKFAETYCATAHRLLAAKGLAPELLYISSEDPEWSQVAKRTMVVMKEVQGWDLATTGHSPRRCVLDDVSRALKTLHGNSLVYGDLRPPNILAVMDERNEATKGMLIDFDWCGPIGQAKYPYNINPAIQWPEGVGPGAEIRVEHDLAMLEKLLGDDY